MAARLSSPSGYMAKALREASFSLTLGVFLGAALTSGAVCGVVSFYVANERLLNRLRGQVKLLALTARDALGAQTNHAPAAHMRHVVLFRYKAEAPVADIVNAFDTLVLELGPLVLGYERGTQCSPEGLGKGLTHAFTLTFASAAARDTYLPHPLHSSFVAKWVTPWVDDVVVFDYDAVDVKS
jgi:hypothetical protein